MTKQEIERILKYIKRHRKTPDLNSAMFSFGIYVEAFENGYHLSAPDDGLDKDMTLEETVEYLFNMGVEHCEV